MTDHELSTAVLHEIKDKHIVPKPRWEFLLKDSAVWIAGIASFIVGGISISVMIHLLASDDFAIAVESGFDPAAIYLASIPYFWILFFIAFLSIARYNLKHTKRGYRYTLPVFAIASLVVSGVLGVVFYAVGIGPDVESELVEHIPAYIDYGHPRAMLWSHPEQGMIAGTVLEVNDDRSFQMQDFRSVVWTVEPATSSDAWPETAPGMHVRLIGQIRADHGFRAIKILPWRPDSPTFFHVIPPKPMPKNSGRNLPPPPNGMQQNIFSDHTLDITTSTSY
jgi:hypothetical protein